MSNSTSCKFSCFGKPLKCFARINFFPLVGMVNILCVEKVRINESKFPLKTSETNPQYQTESCVVHEITFLVETDDYNQLGFDLRDLSSNPADEWGLGKLRTFPHNSYETIVFFPDDLNAPNSCKFHTLILYKQRKSLTYIIDSWIERQLKTVLKIKRVFVKSNGINVWEV